MGEVQRSNEQVSINSKSKEGESILNETQQKIQDLEKKLEFLGYTEKMSKQTKESLYKGLTSDPSIKNDPEAKKTIEMFQRFEKMYKRAVIEGKATREELENLIKMGDKFEHNTGYDSENGKTEALKYDTEKLKTISNREFLSLEFDERLQYVTKNNIDAENISNGVVNDVEFTFTFNGKFNKELYLNTTAGQVLPKEVGEVEYNGSKYIRNNLKGEFFAANGSRLIINEGTQVEIKKLRNVNDLEKDNNSKIEEYLKNNPENNIFKDIVIESINRGKDVDLMINKFKDKIEGMPLLSLDRKTLLEDLFTDLDRIKGGNNKINIDFKKISGGDLSKVDFRLLKGMYPNEASIKNNNPAGLTWNPTFANTLNNHGINFYKGTSRPSSEGGNYFGFENMEEGMNAYNLLWEIKLKKMGDNTFGDFAKNWAVDYYSYKKQFGDIWNIKISSLDSKIIDKIKSKQMRIESPGMYRELQKLGISV